MSTSGSNRYWESEGGNPFTSGRSEIGYSGVADLLTEQFASIPTWGNKFVRGDNPMSADGAQLKRGGRAREALK